MKYDIKTGVFTPPGLLVADATTVTIGAYEVILKATSTSDYVKYTVPVYTSNPLLDTFYYVITDFNGGSPVTALTTSISTINSIDVIVVLQFMFEGVNTKFYNYGLNAKNPGLETERYLIRRDGLVKFGGGIISTPSANYLAITASLCGFGLNSNISTTAFDSSGASRFHYHYHNGTWQETLNQQTWQNTQYNTYNVGLTTISTGTRYSFYEVWLNMNSEIDLVLGQAEYNTLALAESAPRLTNIPPELSNNRGVIYLGKFIFLKSALVAASIIVPATISTFQSVTNHSGLTNLSSDDHTQYAKVTGRANESYTLSGTGGLLQSTYSSTVKAPFIGSKKISGSYGYNAISIQHESSNYDGLSMNITQGNIPYLAFNGTYTNANTYLNSTNSGATILSQNARDFYIDQSYNATSTAGSAMSGPNFLVFRSSSASAGDIYLTPAYTNPVGVTNHVLYIDNAGKIGQVPSLRKFKTIQPDMAYVSFINSLNVITYKRKKEVEGVLVDDPDSPPQVGMIAEEVEAINHNFCTYKDINNPITIRNWVKVTPKYELTGIDYNSMIPVLIKYVQTQNTTILSQKTQIDNLTTTLNNLIIRLNGLENQLIIHLNTPH